GADAFLSLLTPLLSLLSPYALPLLPARRHPRDRLAAHRGRRHRASAPRVPAVRRTLQHLRDGGAETAGHREERRTARGLRRAQAAGELRTRAAEAARGQRRGGCGGA